MCFSPSHLFCTLTVPPHPIKLLFIIASDVQQHSSWSSELAFILLICSSHLMTSPPGQRNPATLLRHLLYILVRNQSRACGLLPPECPPLHILTLGSFWHFNFMGILEGKREHLRQYASYTGLIHSPSSPHMQERLAPQTREDTCCPSDSTNTTHSNPAKDLNQHGSTGWGTRELYPSCWSGNGFEETGATQSPNMLATYFPTEGLRLSQAYKRTYTAFSFHPSIQLLEPSSFHTVQWGWPSGPCCCKPRSRTEL